MDRIVVRKHMVYVLSHGERDEGSSVYGVFSSREKAMEKIPISKDDFEINGNSQVFWESRIDYYSIEEFEVDKI